MVFFPNIIIFARFVSVRAADAGENDRDASRTKKIYRTHVSSRFI